MGCKKRNRVKKRFYEFIEWVKTVINSVDKDGYFVIHIKYDSLQSCRRYSEPDEECLELHSHYLKPVDSDNCGYAFYLSVLQKTDSYRTTVDRQIKEWKETVLSFLEVPEDVIDVFLSLEKEKACEIILDDFSIPEKAIEIIKE